MILNKYAKQFIQLIIAADMSEDELITRATECQIEPMIREYLGNHGIDYTIRQAATAALYRGTLKQALEALEGIRVIVLKGTPMSVRLFGDEVSRQVSDVDLLVSKSDAKLAVLALTSIGFEQDGEIQLDQKHEIALYKEGALAIEIHWSIAPSQFLQPSFDELWQESVISEINKLQFHELSDEHLWIELLLHAITHAGAVKPMIDIAAALDKLSHAEERIKHYKLLNIYNLFRDFIIDDRSFGNNLLKLYYRGILKNAHLGQMVGEPGKLEDSIKFTMMRMFYSTQVDHYLYKYNLLKSYINLIRRGSIQRLSQKLKENR